MPDILTKEQVEALRENLKWLNSCHWIDVKYRRDGQDFSDGGGRFKKAQFWKALATIEFLYAKCEALERVKDVAESYTDYQRADVATVLRKEVEIYVAAEAKGFKDAQ